MQQGGGTCAPAFAYETDYITSIQYPSPAPHIYVGPAYGVNLGSRSVFFLIMMGLITSQAVHGLVAEPSVDNRSLRTLPQRSSLLKLQVLGICCGLPTTGIFIFCLFFVALMLLVL